MHAVSSTSSGWSYQYDANGTQVSRTLSVTETYTLSYDHENQVTAISGNGESNRYVYDGAGNRVLAEVGGIRTIYIGDYFEVELGIAVTAPITLPALRDRPEDIFRCRYESAA